MREVVVNWEKVVNLKRGTMGRGLGGSVHVCAKNLLNNVDRISWYAELGCTGEGRCLMLCNVFTGRDATWQCMCVVFLV